MVAGVLHHMRKKAGQMAYGSPFYSWSLNGAVPERFIMRPVDPWAGSAEKGRWLCQGAFMLEDSRLSLRGDCWEPFGVDEAWLAHMHGFTWLRDLKALGGDPARGQARHLVESWIAHYRNWHALAWRGDILGRRLAMWIALYDFFGDSADEEFQEEFFRSLTRQARHLARALPDKLYGVAALDGIRGLLYAGISLEGREAWAEQALALLAREIDRQVLGDGGHVSRSPMRLLEALQILLDIRCALAAANYPLPEKIQHTIDRMGPALRFFRYNDKHMAQFNGGREGDEALIDGVLAQAGVRGKSPQSMPCTGYEKVTLGRAMLMLDSGKVPAWPHDSECHASPLAFEFCYGRDRLFVSCGTHMTSREWKETLRATAAHNTVSIDCRNACEIREDGHFGRKVRTPHLIREDSRHACLLEGSHDGYMALNGLIHRRRLYLSDQGDDLRGEDSLTCSVGLGRPAEVAIRFHIHPRVLVSLIREGTEALLRLPGGTGWRFHASAGTLALEDSVYMEGGVQPRKTKQLAIYGCMEQDFAQVKWALQRERA